jgi:hypothetical protein
MGSSAYDPETVGKPAKQVFSHLVKLGARPLVTAKSSAKQTVQGKKSKSLMIGDSEVGDADIVFEKWLNGIVGALEEGEGDKITSKGSKKKRPIKNTESLTTETDCACKESGKVDPATDGCCNSVLGSTKEEGGCCSNIDKNDNDNGSSTHSLSDEDDEDGSDIVDLEDMGDIMNAQSLELKSYEPKEMVTKKQAKVSDFLSVSIITLIVELIDSFART